MSLSPSELLGLLRASRDRLVRALDGLSDQQIEASAYPDEWSIAQVCSHLGSGADIFTLFLAAGSRDEAAPGSEQFQPVWDEWNAKSPARQADEVLVSDTRFLESVAALTPEQQERWQLDLFGSHQNLAGLLQMRLSEHVLHTWDIAVAVDPAATLLAEAVGPIIDNLAFLVKIAGQPAAEPTTVEIRTTEPERHLELSLTADGAALSTEPPARASAELVLPAEAFVRLVYGRLDNGHTPSAVKAVGIDLDVLRTTFPGI